MFTINEYRYKKMLKFGIFILFFITESQKNYGTICVNYNTRKQDKRNYKI